MTFVYVVLLALGLISLITSGVMTGAAIHSRKVYGLPFKESNALSEPSRNVLREYLKLPADHRPYANIVYVLRSLDTKHIKSEVESHFRLSGYESSYFSWKGRCEGRKMRCDFEEYHDLHHSIKDITAALEDREYKLALSSVEEGLDAAQLLTKQLREEREHITAATAQVVRKEL